ncbi:MAG: TrmH family RNA methyltransferase [Candidatus Uhrbacteria bacterium]
MVVGLLRAHHLVERLSFYYGGRMIAILHNIRSAHNVGSIFRTADAVGIKKIYLCGYTPGPFDPRGNLRQPFAKVSLGAEQSVPWEHCQSTTRLLDRLRVDGWKIFMVEQAAASTPYYRVRLSKMQKSRVALVVGNEVKGLSRAMLRRADRILEIPMRGKKESLNVSVAFGVVSYALEYPST